MPRPEDVDGAIERLAELPKALPQLLRGFSEEALRRPPRTPPAGVESFTAIGHVCHLRDIEIEGYHVRIRRVRTEDGPRLVSLPGEQMGIERGYDRQDRDRALAAFLAARAETLVVLRGVAPSEWSRPGDFEGYGPVTLLGLVGILGDHDAGHLQALRDLPRD